MTDIIADDRYGVNMTNADTTTAATQQNDPLRSVRFRAEREQHWRRLDELVLRAERGGPGALSYDEAHDLATSYRQAMNSLSVARDISLDAALLEYLETLCARAYLVVYAPQESVVGVILRLLVVGIPQAVRRSALPLLIGFLAMILGAITGYVLFFDDASWFFAFVPPDLADARTPEATAEYLRTTIYDNDKFDSDNLTLFSSFLFSNNTRVAILIFSLGIFLELPSFLLTFYNGLLLGAFYAMFVDKGLGYDMFAWLSIHGVTELAAICIACAGGARLGLAVLLPGGKTRRQALREQSHDAVKLMILAALMLIAAAFIEGFLRQLVQDPQLRLATGWGIGLLWVAWLLLSGRNTPASRGVA